MKARQKISGRKSKLRETIHLGTKLCLCIKTWKEKYYFIDKILMPWKMYRFSSSSSMSWVTSYALLVQLLVIWWLSVCVWLLFNWRKFVTPVFVKKVTARELTDAVGAYAWRWPERHSQGGGKCCHYCPGCTSSVLPPSHFSARSKSGSTDSTEFRQLFCMPCGCTEPVWWSLHKESS